MYWSFRRVNYEIIMKPTGIAINSNFGKASEMNEVKSTRSLWEPIFVGRKITDTKY